MDADEPVAPVEKSWKEKMEELLKAAVNKAHRTKPLLPDPFSQPYPRGMDPEKDGKSKY